jgi:type IV secretion system protein VirB1
VILLTGLIYSAAFLSRCGPSVAPGTTQAIIQVESGGNPLAIGDNNLKKSFAPKTKSEAVSLATQLISQGHSVDLGLMQVNSCHLAPRRLSLEELFDPCRNVGAGTTILSGFYRQYPNRDPNLTLYNALSAYNTGKAWRGAGYVNRILAAAGVDYRILFVPVAKGAETVAPNPDKKKKAMIKSSDSPFFFRNTTTAMVPRRGF